MDAAIHILQQLERVEPDNHRVLFKLGEIAISTKNWAYAIAMLRKASILRPEDIDVRLVLMDIYETYQMPIEEIIVGREILALDPQHAIVLKRLATLYQLQAIQDDEMEIRQQLKHLFPDDYQNLRRLADILDEYGELWEAARVYEQIREYHPEHLQDMRRLAAIYDELDESFRELQVLDHIADQGDNRGWMQEGAEKRLRLQNKVFDPFQAGLAFRKESMEEMEIRSFLSDAKYTHIHLPSSADLALYVKHSRLNHKGKGDLDGTMNIDSGTVALHSVTNWQDQDCRLAATLGILWDNVSSRLFPRDPLSVDSDDFPFLRDPTFSSYGGVMPVGGIQFLYEPGLHTSHQIAYEHGQIDELDARLRMFHFDRVLLGYSYETGDHTELILQIDESAISDGNQRFHGFASAYYSIWGSGAMQDYRGQRKGFFRDPPLMFLRTGYTLEYFTDQEVSNLYESFEDEIRHQVELSGQTRLFQLRPDHDVMLSCRLAYSVGDSLDYREEAGVRVFYFSPESKNEIGLSYSLDNDKVDVTSPNMRLSGRTEVSTISIYAKWRF
jgi:hypothetical protein